LIGGSNPFRPWTTYSAFSALSPHEGGFELKFPVSGCVRKVWFYIELEEPFALLGLAAHQSDQFDERRYFLMPDDEVAEVEYRGGHGDLSVD
jgi:hypothetical protein